MDIGLLKTFIEVSRTRHFGQAAENLFLTQSAISARIRLLEQTVGVPLFTRRRNNIQLTPAGEKLLRHADTILNTWSRAKQEIAVGDSANVPLGVGGVPSLWDTILQTWLNQLVSKNPGLTIHAEVQTPEVLMKRLLEGSLDLAFSFESLQMTELVVEEIGTIDLVMVSSRENIITSQALAEDYVLVNWGTSFAITHAQQFQDMPPPRLHVYLGRIALAFILECGGSAYLAESMAEQAIKQQKLFRVHDAPIIKRKAYAAYSPQSDQRGIIDDVLRYFRGF